MRVSPKSNLLEIVFGLLGIILLAFIFVPLANMIFGTNPAHLLETFKEDEVRASIMLTLKAALLATLLSSVFGIPLAYLLARKDFPFKGFIEGLIDLPIVIPHTAAGIALLLVFGHKFLIGRFFNLFGIQFTDALPGIVIAMAFVSAPFLINSCRDGFEKIDPRLEKVARTLGASPWRTFFSITLPLARREIISGAILMWARGISEFGAIVVLAYHPMVAPILVYERFEAYGLTYSRPVAALLIIICLAIFIILRILSSKRRRV